MRRYHIHLRRQGVGDTVAATALTRDLVALHPDTRISLEGNSCDDVFGPEPWYDRARDPGARFVHVDYKATIDRGGLGDRTARYVYAAHEGFEAGSGVAVPRGSRVPKLTLSAAERVRPYAAPYCVVAAGTKQDLPAKNWGHGNFRAVVGATRGWNWKQVGLAHDGRFVHFQTALDGAENLLCRTSLRDLFRLIAHAECVLCHLSLPMLVAAAFGVPCVAVAGGRESPWLFDDLGPTVLHTVGELPCCETRGCYASGVVPGADPGRFPPGWACRRPLAVADERPVGECMTRVAPDRVVTELERVRRAKSNPG